GPAIAVAESVAPESDLLGVMLPYTPLHHWLLRETARPIVLTSGNRAQEPIAFRVGDFTARLPWPDVSFAAVLDGVALYANPLAAIERALSEVERVLEPGGLFLSISLADEVRRRVLVQDLPALGVVGRDPSLVLGVFLEVAEIASFGAPT